jgi:hypothetical protein
MSGYKRATVTISQEEYRRLHEADMQRRFRKKKNIDRREEDRQVKEISAAFDVLQNRQNYYESLITELGDEIARMEEHRYEELLAYQTAFNQELTDRLDVATSETDAVVEDLRQRFQEELQEQRQTFSQGLHRLDQHLGRWAEQERNKQATANQWLTQSAAIYDFINDQFDTERFAPGRMNQIHQRLLMAQMNLEQGMPEASLQLAQQAFMELSELRVELERRTMEWQSQFQITYATAKELQRTILENSQVPALDVAGNEIPFPVDLDYWSCGTYREILNEAKQLCQTLKEQQRSLSVNQLQQIRTEEFTRLQTSLETVIYESRLEAIQSQLRINIADLALQSLETQGYRLEEAGFADNDLRGPFVAKLINEDRSRISLKIMPKQGQDLSNDLVVISNDAAMRTAGELFARFQAIRSSLGQRGLAIRQVHSNPPAAQTEPLTNDLAVPNKVTDYRRTSNV